MENPPTIDENKHHRVQTELSYSATLEGAVQLILGDPVLIDEGETYSFKFIRAARFLKAHAPHVFHIREMHAKASNRMDRWLWDFLG